MVPLESEPTVQRQSGPTLACLLRIPVNYPVELPPEMDHIEVHHYENLPAQFGLRETPAKLGRWGDSDLVLRLPTISRNHAEFQFLDGHWQMRDTNSLNGMEINQVPLTPNIFYNLANNDVISFAASQPADYRFVESNERIH